MDEAELQKLREEKERLLENSKHNEEADKLKKEIEDLKNPKKPKKEMNPKVKGFFKSAFNAAANLGDAAIAMGGKTGRKVFADPKNVPSKQGASKSTSSVAGPAKTDGKKTPKQIIGKKKYFKNKMDALNDCEKGENAYYDAKEELYYVIKLTTSPKSTPTPEPGSKPTAKKKPNALSGIDDTMKNIEKEMSKFDMY